MTTGSLGPRVILVKIGLVRSTLSIAGRQLPRFIEILLSATIVLYWASRLRTWVVTLLGLLE